MPCYAALRRPLRTGITSIGSVRRAPDNATHAQDSSDRILGRRPATHDPSKPTVDRTLASLHHVRPLAGSKRWLRGVGRLVDRPARGVLWYSTAAAASETQEDSATAASGRGDAQESGHDQGLRITTALLPQTDGKAVRYLPTSAQRDSALHFPPELALRDRLASNARTASHRHGPVRRVLVKTPARHPDANAGTRTDEADAQHPAEQPATSSYFDDMVEAVRESRPRDGADYTAYQPSFGRQYFVRQQKELRVQKATHERMVQLQAERHPRLKHNDWQGILQQLDAHTPAGSELYKQKVDKLTLPEGFLAVFHHDISLAILEIRQRTGSHLQVVEGVSQKISVDGRTKTAYAVLALSGLANENDAALQLLPEYAYVYSEHELSASRNMHDYDLQRRQYHLPDGDNHEVPNGHSNVETSPSHDPHSDDDGHLSLSDLDMLNDAVKSVTSPVRAVWSVSRWYTDYVRHQVGVRPTMVSRTSMTQYIFEITMSLPNMAVRNKRAKDETASGDEAHVTKVIEELVSLCTGPAAPSWLTSEALDKSLHYLLAHNDLKAFRTIRQSLDNGGKYEFTASNYAVLLNGAARSGDLHNFRYLTMEMIKRRLPLTAHVWMHFHKLVCVRGASEVFGPLEGMMRTKGLLVNQKLAKAVSMESVLEELHEELKAGTPFEAFWHKCNLRIQATYPPGFRWFSHEVANRMIQLFLQWGRLDDAYIVLERLRKRNIPVPTSTLNIFLSSALRNRDSAAAASIVQRFKIGKPGAIIPDHITYAELFTTAWLQRYFNVLRVVWRYACAAGHVNYSMRYRLRRSLCSATPPGNTPTDGISRGMLWNLWAGKFAVGVARGLSKRSERGETVVLTESEQHLLQLISREECENGSEAEYARYGALLELMHNDLNEVNNCRPVHPLSQALAKAYAKDIAWKESSFGLPKALEEHRDPHDMFVEMLKKGVKVHMEAGDFSRNMRRWEAPGAIALLESEE
ncbi:hypothetical protein CLAFUR0_04711 [Fulvia fulva]|nr:hypothetical protein CLAFUR0_04711 [Fulvia fulva]